MELKWAQGDERVGPCGSGVHRALVDALAEACVHIVVVFLCFLRPRREQKMGAKQVILLN